MSALKVTLDSADSVSQQKEDSLVTKKNKKKKKMTKSNYNGFDFINKNGKKLLIGGIPIVLLLSIILGLKSSNEPKTSKDKEGETQDNKEIKNLINENSRSNYLYPRRFSCSNKGISVNMVQAKSDSMFNEIRNSNYWQSREQCIKFLNGNYMLGAINEIKKDKTLVELNLKDDEDVLFIGDLHCSINSLKSMAKPLCEKLCAGKTFVVFTGDYADPKGDWISYSKTPWDKVEKNCVDKCNGSYGCLCLAAYLKCQFPKKVILLRGNHESSGNNNYGGRSWLLGGKNIVHEPTNDNNAVQALERVDDFNSLLPLGAKIRTGSKTIVALHGCLHRNMDQIENKVRGNKGFIDIPEFPVATNILWNEISWENEDLDDHRGMKLKLLKRSELEEIMKKQSIDYFVHGHNHTEDTYKPLSNNKGVFCAIAIDFREGDGENARIVQFKNGTPKIIWRENWKDWKGQSVEEYLKSKNENNAKN